jgi:hypothetical protein
MIMNTTRFFQALALTSLVGAVACGGTSYDSGVDDSKQVKDLDASDAAAICAAAEETSKSFFEDHKGGLCKFAGVFAAFGGGEAACEAAVTECEKQEPDTTSDASCEPIVADCDATVGEVEACFNDSLEVVGSFFDELDSKSCGELLADSSESSLDITEPASCTALAAKCPSLEFGNVGVGTSTSS